ncbi:unnamed protein product [Orchesella dallaii]|uniref:Uncharacterized protein n=1 Tax=Orchesella dallaii TaxID=48710 RepID=A0ABP1RQB4_9HEXA
MKLKNNVIHFYVFLLPDSALSFKRIDSTGKSTEKAVLEWFRLYGDSIKQENNKLVIKSTVPLQELPQHN